MKYLIKFLLIFCFVELSAQTEQNFILSTSAGYSYKYEDKADYSNFNYDFIQFTDRKINDFNLSVAIGKQLQTNFYYGLGIVWNTRTVEINPDADKPISGITPGYSYVTNRSNIVVATNVVSPLVYLQYYVNLSERMHFTLDLVSQYDFIKNTDERTLYRIDPTFLLWPKNAPSSSPVIIASDKSESDQQYFNIGIHPGFRLNLYKSLGMNIAFGSVAYRIKTAESRLPDMDIKRSREFNVKFTPENWRVGFYLAF